MTITPEELKRRRGYLCSSDAPSLFGLGFDTLGGVYLSKTQELEDKPNKAMAAGNYHEEGLIRYAEDEIGMKIERGGEFIDGIHMSHPDGWIGIRGETPIAIVEAKLSSEREKWGEEGSDEIPDGYMIQVQHQLLVSGADLAYVVAGLTGWGLEHRVYRVEPHVALQQQIVERAEGFMRQCVAKGIPPIEPPRLDTVKKVVRAEGKTVPLDEILVRDWESLKSQRIHLAKIEANAQAQMLAALGDAEIGTFTRDGKNMRLEYVGVPQNRKAQPAKTITVRTPRIKEEKE